jgi:hypothetical protein
MPSNATEYGEPIDFTGSIAQIAAEIRRLVARTPRSRARTSV